MQLNEFVGNKIKTFREARGMTQDMLADKLNTTRQTISRYENGDRKANQDVLFDLSVIFGVKVDDFFPSRDNISEESPLATIAAHMANSEKKLTKSDIDKINDYIDLILDSKK